MNLPNRKFFPSLERSKIKTARILELSTRHVPDNPQFAIWKDSPNAPKVVRHIGGWFVYPTVTAIASNWLQPIVEVALNHGCSLISFDNRLDVSDQFKVFDNGSEI